MFFNHPLEPSEPRFPPSVFARVDQIEETTEGDQLVVFDCIDADFVEKLDPNFPALCEFSDDFGWAADSALSIVVADANPFKKLMNKIAEDQWYRIVFSDSDSVIFLVDQYTTLFSDPTPRGVVHIEPVTGDMENHLRHLADWGSASPSDVREIEKALASINSPDAVAIYDVGQGAATALLSRGYPCLYFDFGGSAIGNWRSFPSHLRKFCFTDQPPIVLSHWDWDHWSSALRDRRALNSTWVLPLQSQGGSLGNVHARFLALLYAHGTTVLWWDPALQSLRLPAANARIVKADGPQTSRNESGLALVVDKSTIHSRAVLLPGDASFVHLEANVGTKFDHVMVPHHGGKTDTSVLPKAATKSRSHQIYSYGVGNIFMHPLPPTVKAFRTEWKRNTHVALRGDDGFGHLGISLNTKHSTRTTLPCNGSCQLRIHRWI